MQGIQALGNERTADHASITVESSASEKIGLFRRLFSGRTDVFPLRWENRNTGKSGYSPACVKEWVRGVCGKPQVKCGECRNQAFLTVSDQVIANHLRGVDRDGSASADYVAGVYPILPEGSCHFVAADFDGAQWAADALAYWKTCRRRGVPAALERSRSGEGGHVWIFFSQAIPARDARQLAAVLITETLERRPELGFTSYDRLSRVKMPFPRAALGISSRCHFNGAHAITETASSSIRSSMRIATNGRFSQNSAVCRRKQFIHWLVMPRCAIAFLPSGCPLRKKMATTHGTGRCPEISLRVE